MKISPTIRKHLKLFVIMLVAVIILDQIVAILTVSHRPVHQPGPYWNWGAHHFLQYTGLSGAAAYNDTLSEIWFAETMTFILAPLLLIWLYRRLNLKFWTPWILTGLVAILAIVSNFDRVYSVNSAVGPPQFTEIFHDGANSPIHKNVDVDYMLETEFWEFLTAQLLFIVPFSIGYLATRKPRHQD
jgi:hypothetical protein